MVSEGRDAPASAGPRAVEGVLEKFEMSLEEAQQLVMTARVMLGWVDPAELAPKVDEDANAEAEA